MSATQTVPAVVPVAPVALIAPVAPVALVVPVALIAPVAPVAPGHRPTKAHKNPDFVLESAKNGDPEGKKRTKTSILCSGSPKTGVPEGKKAQKPRFCARKARKQGFQTAKAHKNADFVLESAKNGGFEGQKSTKTSILCSGRLGLAPGREEIGIGKHNRRDAYRKRCLPANHRARFQNANT